MSNKFTPEFIAEQLELAAKATPRPWKQSLDRVYYKVHDSVGFQEWTSMNAHYLDGSPVDDSAYIVAAANNYPAALEEIARLREAQRWIPVGERMPEVKGRYLFQAKSTVSNRYFVSIEYYEPGWGTPPLFTHWKPIPPPQEAEG